MPKHLLFNPAVFLSAEETSIHKYFPDQSFPVDSVIYESANDLGTESCFTFFYINGHDVAIPGFLTYIQQIGRSIYFCIHEEPCCSGNIVTYSWYRINPLFDTLSCQGQLVHYIHLTGQTLPVQKKKCHIARHDMKIRSNPFINDAEYDEDLRQEGNIIGEIKKGKIYFLLNLQSVNGQLWGLVSVKTSKCRSKLTYLCGWVLLN